MRRGAVIFNVGFPGLPGYCYNELDGQWYAQFGGLLINRHMPDHLIQRIVDYLES